MTLEEMKIVAPAVFATQSHPKRSTKYQHFNTGVVVENLMKEGWIPDRCGQQRTHLADDRSYTSHMVTLSRPDLRFQNEQIEVVLTNAHNGRQKFGFELGVFRFICCNGLIDSSTQFGELRLRHLGYTEAQVYEAAEKIIERVPVIRSRIEAWRAHGMSMGAQLRFARWALVQRWPLDPPISAEDLLYIRRLDDRHANLWCTFNRIQENLLKGGQHYRGPSRAQTVRAISSINSHLSLNRRLWAGAESIASGVALPA